MRCFLVLALFGVFASPAIAAPPAPDANRLLDSEIMKKIENWMDTDIVRLSITTQNEKYGSLSQDEISALDETWKKERKSKDKPLIAATLSNPLSVYLSRMQGQSVGLFVEIFVMDNKGLNVGQSSITSDFWQGDEAKYQKTFPKGPHAVFIDEAEWDEDLKIWRAQINKTVTDSSGKTPIGAVTVEVNLTELQRRSEAAGY